MGYVWGDLLGVFTQKELEGLIQDTRFEVLERAQREMTRFLRTSRDPQRVDAKGFI